MKLIVGVDSGTTTGLAILDLSPDYDFYKTFSRKGLTFDEICRFIADYGKPVIIAADKTPTRTVKRIASAFNARLVFREMNVKKKRALTKNKKYRSLHERDALAAAINAKRRFLPMIKKIDAMLKRKNIEYLSEGVKELVLKQSAANTEQAIRLIKSQEKITLNEEKKS